jgi:hypothetical protein
VSEHLRTKVGQILACCSSASEAQLTFVALHLALPILETLLNLVME